MPDRVAYISIYLSIPKYIKTLYANFTFFISFKKITFDEMRT